MERARRVGLAKTVPELVGRAEMNPRESHDFGGLIHVWCGVWDESRPRVTLHCQPR